MRPRRSPLEDATHGLRLERARPQALQLSRRAREGPRRRSRRGRGRGRVRCRRAPATRSLPAASPACGLLRRSRNTVFRAGRRSCARCSRSALRAPRRGRGVDPRPARRARPSGRRAWGLALRRRDRGLRRMPRGMRARGRRRCRRRWRSTPARDRGGRLGREEGTVAVLALSADELRSRRDDRRARPAQEVARTILCEVTTNVVPFGSSTRLPLSRTRTLCGFASASWRLFPSNDFRWPPSSVPL